MKLASKLFAALLGIAAVSGFASAGSSDASGIKTAVTDLKRHADTIKSELLKKPESDSKQIEDRHKQVVSWLDDRQKAALDNVQKFLDIIRSMNPQI